ncbi:hypothetical protein SAMN05216198_1528 [Halopseudomonas litoralis]|uniref:Uncharacterized protein n=1 Tax=Halopseudomonas litoralis TaxID=797277 RepID=A0A1H1QMV3_9GAMM|nr:hypothetical protein SAMN05216198_1528 [Halopseudomonas litoralis]
MTTLSPLVIAICEQHYIEAGRRNGCGRCPIHAQCTAPMNGWSWEALAEHNRKINEAVAKRAEG